MGALENDLNPDTGIGLSFPLGRSESGFFQQTQTTLEQTSHNIKNLLLTSKGERVMQPEFGSRLKELIFEQGPGLRDRIDEAIRDATSSWLPYINIIDIQVLETSDTNEVNVSLEFSVSLEPDSFETITFNFNIGE